MEWDLSGSGYHTPVCHSRKLVRILSPSDFGLMRMIMVVIGFAQAFADMGQMLLSTGRMPQGKSFPAFISLIFGRDLKRWTTFVGCANPMSGRYRIEEFVRIALVDHLK